MSDFTTSPLVALGLTTPEQHERYLKWREAQRTADREAANHYRLLLGDAFFRRLQGTWSPLINPAPVVTKDVSI